MAWDVMRSTLILLLVASMTTASAAVTPDKCLTGASALNDQRSLAYVKDSIETACPCASYTGAPGLTRAAYRRCAKQMRDDAISIGAMRSQCRRLATQQYRQAVCGTTKIACGEFKASSFKQPVRCQVKASTRCTTTPLLEENVCPQTRCADVVDWTAGTCDDVRQPGAFATGVRIITYTKQSVVNPSQQRVLPTTIWYPAPAGSGPVDPVYGGVMDAPLDNSAGPYPLVMFSHGSCGFPEQSTFLWSLIASRGYIVVAPPHPGNTIASFPACSSVSTLIASAQERPQDIIYVLDQVLAANTDSLSPLFGSIDPSRIGMAGHSFGGFTTYLVVAADARFKVAVPLAPAVPGSPVLTIPSLTMLSELDTYVSNPPIQTAYGAALPPKYMVEIQSAGHFAYSDGCFPSPDCNPPTTTTQDESHAIVLRWVVPFLERYLAGHQSYHQFLVAPAPTGVVFAASE